jgi:hypothetical protein
LRKVLDFWGVPAGLGEWLLGRGLVDLVVGRKVSGNTSTKLEGNNPTARLSRHNLPVHHEPSPALRHSMRSPSINPRSRLDCDAVVRISSSSKSRGSSSSATKQTHLSSPRVHGADPARKARRQRRWRQNHCCGRATRARLLTRFRIDRFVAK